MLCCQSSHGKYTRPFRRLHLHNWVIIQRWRQTKHIHWANILEPEHWESNYRMDLGLMCWVYINSTCIIWEDYRLRFQSKVTFYCLGFVLYRNSITRNIQYIWFDFIYWSLMKWCIDGTCDDGRQTSIYSTHVAVKQWTTQLRSRLTDILLCPSICCFVGGILCMSRFECAHRPVIGFRIINI